MSGILDFGAGSGLASLETLREDVRLFTKGNLVSGINLHRMLENRYRGSLIRVCMTINSLESAPNISELSVILGNSRPTTYVKMKSHPLFMPTYMLLIAVFNDLFDIEGKKKRDVNKWLIKFYRTMSFEIEKAYMEELIGNTSSFTKASGIDGRARTTSFRKAAEKVNLKPDINNTPQHLRENVSKRRGDIRATRPFSQRYFSLENVAFKLKKKVQTEVTDMFLQKQGIYLAKLMDFALRFLLLTSAIMGAMVSIYFTQRGLTVSSDNVFISYAGAISLSLILMLSAYLYKWATMDGQNHHTDRNGSSTRFIVVTQFERYIEYTDE